MGEIHFKQQHSKCKDPETEVQACSKKRRDSVAYSEKSKVVGEKRVVGGELGEAMETL